MITDTIEMIHDTVPMDYASDPYREQGFDGDLETGEWLLLQASRMDGAIHQGWKLRLVQGEILTQVRDRVPGFFDKWLEAHWPDMSRTTVTRLMDTWKHREQLSPFIDDANCSHGNNPLPIKAVDTLAVGGAIPEVIEEVLRRLKEGKHVGAQEVADLNREAKAKRSGKATSRPIQPTETLALSMIRKGEIDRHREALALAERAEVVTADQVMAELRLRELPKGNRILGAEADFHRLKDGQWVRMPHAGRVDVEPKPEPISAFTNDDSSEVLSVDVEPEPQTQSKPDILAMPPVVGVGLMSWEGAAKRLGVAVSTLRLRLSPAVMAKKGVYERNGYRAVKEGRGTVRVTPVTQ